ncbi:hypothetical protein [Paludisphaera mucosa]|uniref:Glycosyltransferase RgtA/B/C/D-like domain-containing protein n=1 Tax=Paludisphaera mucosa TaxID=3030827 RepID=A0ABT6F7E9_9BACT|nr:hypothetical protein [Paludisphaera mucosa]MDG3003500.1 hypothetical protein [Paludisphaera mucosa]
MSWMLVALGIVVRLVRYLVDYPIWHDEAFLAASLWDRGFGDLAARPLEYGQVAPWLFMAIERLFVQALGYSELTLRLFPTICSVASVVVFRHLISRVVRGWGLVLATGVLACAFYPIRHGNEIKPYASDLLAAILILTFAVEYLRRPDSPRWWWIGAAALPVLLGVSYPAVFVSGGVCAATAPGILLRGSTRVRAAFVAYGLVMVASFLSIYLAATVVQQREMGSHYRFGYWKDSFPPLDSPAWIPVWLLDQHAGNLMGYPVGERRGGSTATLICAIAGITALWRAGRRTLAATLTAPFALGLTAAFLGRYPYGGEARIVQYLAPTACLAAGLGMAVLASRIRRPRLAIRIPRILLSALVLLGLGLIVKDVVRPYRVAKDVRSRDFARRFWTEQARDADLACAKADFGLEIDPHTWEAGMSAVYLFHQRLYSPRHRAKAPFAPNPLHIFEKRPLRLVLFRDYEADHPAVQAWLAEMGRDYTLISTKSFVVDPASSRESWLRDAYGVFDFVSREGSTTARGADSPASPRRF